MSLIPGKQKLNKIYDLNTDYKVNLKGYLDEEEAQVTLAKFLRKNLGVTVELLYRINLYPFQEILLRSWFIRNFCLNVFGRGVSKSFTASVFIPLWCIFNPNTKVCIVSTNFRTSRRILQQIELFVNNPNAKKLAQCFKTAKPIKRPDQWEWELTNGSKFFCLPLSGENLRGIRADVLVIDEALMVPQETIEKVLFPFLVAKTGQDKILAIRKQEDYLIDQKLMREEDRMVFHTEKKMILLSSASYQVEYLYQVYKKWMKKIGAMEDNEETDNTPVLDENGKKKKDAEEDDAFKNAKYFVAQIGYQAAPKDLIDPDIIEEAQSGGLKNATFLREYCAQFVDDGGSYYSMENMNACTIPNGQNPHLELKGDKDEEYLLAIDPNRSKSEVSDHFAMCVLKLDKANKTGCVVHSYARAGGEFKDHIDYLVYLLTNFNIVFVIVDNAGSEYIDYCNETEIFKERGLKINFFDADFDAPDQLKAIHEAKANYKLVSKDYCYKQYFSPLWIRKANEWLQTCFQQKKIFFGSLIAPHPSFESIIKAEIPEQVLKTFRDIDAVNFAVQDFADNQDDLIALTKKECALIEISTSPTGIQQFDLPKFLKNMKTKNKVRKDSYTALVLAAWGMKCYFDMITTERRNPAFFMPFSG